MDRTNEILSSLDHYLSKTVFQIIDLDTTFHAFMICNSQEIKIIAEKDYRQFIALKNEIINKTLLQYSYSYNFHKINKQLDFFNKSLYNQFRNPNIPDFENRYIQELIDDVLIAIRNYQPPKEKSGCYIATMAYGDYDHPQVLELRKFRDDFLSKTIFGRSFINFYYKNSPRLVERLKNKQTVNLIIRKGLNQFIKTIRK